jgi:Tfp pilus assembly protein PilN
MQRQSGWRFGELIMKIDINVLPDAQKEKINEERRIGNMLKLFFSLIMVLLIVNIVLYAMRIILNVELQVEKKSSESVMQRISGKEDQLENIFKKTGVQVANLKKIRSAIPNWARVLARISELSPDGIRVSQITAEGMQMKISGFAKTRDDLIAFQDRMHSEGFQSPVDISNLVASKNFKFDLNLAISQDYLIRK